MYTALIVAGGAGARTGLNYRKIWYDIQGRPLIDYTIACFTADPDCSQIVLVGHAEDCARLKERFHACADIVLGGTSRTESVYAGLQKVTEDIVFVHDAVRPCVSKTVLERLKNALSNHDALTLAVPIVDTLKRVDKTQIVEDVSRAHLVAIQTPQVFVRDKLMAAYRLWAAQGRPEISCDASLYQAMLAEPVSYVLGARENIKFTTLDDVQLLKAVLT